MAIVPYLSFRNNTKEVVAFYEKALGATDLVITTFADMGDDPSFPMSEADKQLVANASLTICGTGIMISDVPDMMAEGFVVGNNFSLTISDTDKDKLQLYFANLSEGGEIAMPLGEVEWSPMFGMVTDKFGINWQVNLEASPQTP